MRKIGILAAFVVCGAVILAGLVYLSNAQGKKGKSATTHNKAAEEADLKRTEALLSKGRTEDALKIIHQYEDQISVRTETGRQWLNLLIESSIQTANFGQLIILFEAYPQAFNDNEKASLMAADGYILARRPQDYQKIRNEWKEKGQLQDTWLVLDTDSMLLEGKRNEALQLLKSSKFEGKQDVNRLVRLALLYVIEDPKAAWDYLAEAYALDPQNPDIITYRGKLLESLGKDPLALYEYLAAIQAAPDNLFLRDQLAEFYMRRNQAPLALSVWLETLSKPSLDLIWIKALFWSKMISPVKFDWAKASPPVGADKPFIEYFASLPAGTFWNEEAFDKLSNGKKFLSNLQATFWLRLLQALKDGNDKEARNLLQFNNFEKDSLNENLEKALKQIISYRATGRLNYDVTPINGNAKGVEEAKAESPDDRSVKSGETFFTQLNNLADTELNDKDGQRVPQSINDLLTGQEAFAAAFLSAGWLEAALQLHKVEVLPENTPDWVAYGLTQAMNLNRSPSEALAFALKQTKTAPLSLLIGELYIAVNKPDEALAVLEPFLKDKTDVGYRASWLAAVIYADKQDYAKAKEAIEGQPKLAEDTLGKEMLARIALLQGDTDLADKIYMQLQEQSPEAMSYLARKAYDDKNWKRARELTEQLLLMFPDSPILRENLNKIVEEQSAQKAP